jgi:hypothetical protein
MSLAERLLGELEADPRARRRLAELLVAEPDVRLAMINAIIADVATRRDLAELRSEMRGEISALRAEIAQLRAEASGNFRWIIGAILAIWGATAMPILLRLIGAI